MSLQYKSFAIASLLTLTMASRPAYAEALVKVNSGSNLVVNSTLTLPTDASLEIRSGGVSRVNETGIVDGNVTVKSGGILYHSGTITRSLINEGQLYFESGGAPVITTDFINDGSGSITHNTTLSVSGELRNNGLLDILTAGPINSGTFLNNGTLWDRNAAARATEISMSDGTRLSITTPSSHLYQLQWRSRLDGGSWTNIEDPVAGPGFISILNTEAPVSDKTGFYRFVVSDN